MHASRASTVGFVAGLIAWLASIGCSFEAVQPTGKPCPCAAGLVCDATTNTCVQQGVSSSAISSSASGMSSGSGGGAPNDVVAIGSYDIDTRETTVAQYQAFLDSKPPIVGQPPKCSWNDSFEPATAGPCTGTFDLVSYPERPVVCIDWCDAVAYCTWRGRRLCGQIGGGQLAYADASDPAKSEWGNACTKGGALVYPYGNDYIPDACNTAQKNFGGLTEVATVITCVGGYEGLLDMSGNAEEWEDACSEGEDPNDPRDDSCHARGGAYWTDGDQSTCAADIAPTRNSQDHSTGIRCCGSL